MFQYLSYRKESQKEGIWMELKSRFCKESMMVEKWLKLLRVGASRVEWKRVNEKTGSLIHGNRYSVMKYNGHERGFEDNRSLWEIPGLKYQTWWWLSQLRAASDVKLQCLMLGVDSLWVREGSLHSPWQPKNFKDLQEGWRFKALLQNTWNHIRKSGLRVVGNMTKWNSEHLRSLVIKQEKKKTL